jgi:hypothetical protein
LCRWMRLKHERRRPALDFPLVWETYSPVVVSFLRFSAFCRILLVNEELRKVHYSLHCTATKKIKSFFAKIPFKK